MKNEIKTKVLIDWCIFILLSRESDGALYFGRIRTRLGVDHFPSFPVDVLTSSHVNLLLVRSHQAEIIIVKRLIQGRNNVTRVRVLHFCAQKMIATNTLALVNKMAKQIHFS